MADDEDWDVELFGKREKSSSSNLSSEIAEIVADVNNHHAKVC